MKRRPLVLGLGAALALPAAAQPAPAASAPRRARLVLAGPYATVSFPLIHMAESGALAGFAEQVVFTGWRTPDQLRALAVDGGAAFVAAPTNVAANLYNRGVALQLLNVSVWGMLSLVSRSAAMKTLADFKGQEIAVPFRADMPDIVLQLLAQAQGLDAQRDFRLRYVPTPMDAVQLLIHRRVDHALLAEPMTSMALRRTRSFPVSVIAPELFRSVDLQQEWGRVFERAPRIPQAGIAALGAVRDDAALLSAFRAAYRASAQWCVQQPAECGALVARHVEMLDAAAVADALRQAPLQEVPAAETRAELAFFFGLLHERQSALVGGRLPDAAFYGLLD